MRPLRARTAKSSSRSSKTSDVAFPGHVAVAAVVGAHSLAGILRVRAYQPPAPSLRAGSRILIEREGARTEARVRSAAPHGRGLLLVALEGITDRTAAEGLIGARLLVPMADLP